MMGLYSRLRPLAFALPPEAAHELGKRALRAAGSSKFSRGALASVYRYEHPSLEIDCFGTTFPNPIGVAAGFDKNAECYHALGALGFGFVEVGTVTPYPQRGNEKPRLFRLPEDEALINRMGLNGDGMDRVRARLEADGRPAVPLGVNVGKMNSSTATEAVEDYRRVFDRLSSFADYVVVNVSCPNTPDAFEESSPDHLRSIFETLEAENTDDTPILVKIGPDAPKESILDLVRIVESFDVDGVVATNTSAKREGLESSNRSEWGGLSGRPIQDRSTAIIRTIAQHSSVPIVGVGGVDSADSAYEKIRAGASLLELYTAFVYNGPRTAREINAGLVDRLERDGFSSVEAAVGADLD